MIGGAVRFRPGATRPIVFISQKHYKSGENQTYEAYRRIFGQSVGGFPLLPLQSAVGF